MTKENKTLKTLFESEKELSDKQIFTNNLIEKFILNELKEINEEFFNQDDLSKNWKVNVFENEFTLVYKFGNIDYCDIIRMSSIYEKYDFKLYCISDITTYNKYQSGLVFYFKGYKTTQKDR